MTKIWVFFILALVLLSSSFFLQVARCKSDSDSDNDAGLVAQTVEEGGDLGVVGDDVQDIGGGSFIPAPGVEIVSVFPKSPSKSVVAGEETELLIGMKNEGEQSVKVLAVHASVHLPFDHRVLVQNLSAQAFNKASVPASVQATFPYTFAVSKFLQPGTYDLVGTIVYEINRLPYQNIFYNGTIVVTEAGGLVSVETIFLISLGIALLVLFGLWVRSQIENVSKKTKRAPKVEVGTRTVDASMDEWLQVEDGGAAADEYTFRSLVGGLIYLTHSRPDISFAVGVVSRYMHKPSVYHMGAVKRILRYVAGTMNLGLWYAKTDCVGLVGYTDSDWASSVEDRKSTSANVFSIGTAAVAWSSKKQEIVALSTTEDEYVATTAAVCQATWMRKILFELGHEQEGATQIFCDNMSAVFLSKNQAYHGRSKHIDTKFHFIRNLVEGRQIELQSCSSQEQVADILTKALGTEQFMYLRGRLGLTTL